MTRSREELHQMVKVMVLAGIQADGKKLSDLTPEEINERSESAARDLKFALEIIEQKKDISTLHAKAAASIAAGACPCFRCIRERGEPQIYHGSASCACGNKRCPHASDHRFACTNSNATGQPGSDYA